MPTPPEISTSGRAGSSGVWSVNSPHGGRSGDLVLLFIGRGSRYVQPRLKVVQLVWPFRCVIGGSKRFLVVPLMVIAMGDMVLPGEPIGGALGGWKGWFELLLATPVVLWCGWPFFVRGWRSVARRRLNMFTLIAIGVEHAPWLVHQARIQQETHRMAHALISESRR